MRILLIIGGGIAAYRSLELVRLYRKAGHDVTAILTRAGAAFVTPLSVGALSGSKVHEHLLSLTDELDMGHIELSRSADLIVVAPATADFMAKAASGLADDLATTTLLATDTPVLMAPAMNVRMWTHAATQRNLATLQRDGVQMVGPDEGEMACGEFGAGRMAAPEAIFAASLKFANPPVQNALKGRKVLITAGPTREALDPVRYISNHSSGKQGYALAVAAAELGADVVLVSGPVNLFPPSGVRVVRVETARDMLAACEAELPCDLAIFTAAVADWRAAEAAPHKLKKGKSGVPTLSLVENPDILATLAKAGPHRPRFVVGFAAETIDVVAHARAKLNAKGADLVVANDVGAHTGVFGGDSNSVVIIRAGGEEVWPTLSKQDVARRLMALLTKEFS